MSWAVTGNGRVKHYGVARDPDSHWLWGPRSWRVTSDWTIAIWGDCCVILFNSSSSRRVTTLARTQQKGQDTRSRWRTHLGTVGQCDLQGAGGPARASRLEAAKLRPGTAGEKQGGGSRGLGPSSPVGSGGQPCSPVCVRKLRQRCAMPAEGVARALSALRVTPVTQNSRLRVIDGKPGRAGIRRS
ncbi:uncharacterized protein LOC128928296 isoform X2 [Callithrix jacchus]